jgi:hypothetical protein
MNKKQLLVDAIIGRGFRSIQHSVAMTEEGLARFNGNQHNESWEWKRNSLMEMETTQLKAIYCED